MKKEEKIVTRTFQYGNECESSWPPKYGTRGAGHFYWDETTRKMVEGYPSPKYPRYGEAPAIISDEMDPYYHPAALRVVESKSQLRKLDAATGTITTDRIERVSSNSWKETNKKIKKDRDEAFEKAIAQCDAGMAPISEETKALCAENNARLQNLTGVDTFNFLGRKNDPRGRSYRKGRIKRRNTGK